MNGIFCEDRCYRIRNVGYVLNDLLFLFIKYVYIKIKNIVFVYVGYMFREEVFFM